MKRKEFLQTSAMLSAGTMWWPGKIAFGEISEREDTIYQLFKNPLMSYHPYVRWWWNGDKVGESRIDQRT